MEVNASRFGRIQASPSDILTFEQGLIGLRQCRRWIVLADAQNPALGWLQSIDDPDVALGVVSPRRFVADYQLRVACHDTAELDVLLRTLRRRCGAADTETTLILRAGPPLAR